MCNRYTALSKPEEKITIETIRKLPQRYFTNITVVRTGLKGIVWERYKKSEWIVTSTNGSFTDRFVDLLRFRWRWS